MQSTETRLCPNCGHDHPLTDFIKHNRRCRTCRNDYAKAWRAANRGHVNAYFLRYLSQPEQHVRHLCRLATASLIRAGKLIRPTVCEVCGSETTLRAHHWNYSNPEQLTWTCSHCHPDLDAQRRAVEQAQQELLRRIFPSLMGGSDHANA